MKKSRFSWRTVLWSMLFMLVLPVFGVLAGSESNEHDVEHSENGMHLPEKYADLLRDEMKLLEKEMQALMSAIAGGQWHVIHEKGVSIYNSLIIRKRLSRHEHEELHDLLPPGFLEMDMKFHEYGKRLAQAAEMRDAELVGYYYGRMVQGCLSCHSRFAANKFTGFAENGAVDHQHH